MNLSGLSATYPGYMAQEDQTAKTQQNQALAQEAAFKLLGAQVLGRAMAGGQPGTPGGGPQPPPPGQASMPSAPPPQAGAPRPPQGGPPPAPPPQPAAGPAGAPPAQGGSGMPEISLQALTQRILQTSPQVAQHPQILLAALERAASILDRQSREDLAELRKQMSTQRLEQAGQLARERIETQRAAESGRQGRFDAREGRLAAAATIRQDQGYQRLEMQKQDLARKVEQGGDKQALAQWRAVVDAQHKRATEIIQSNNMMSGLSKEDKASLLAEQRKAYEEDIAGMRTKMTAPPAAAPVAPSSATNTPSNATSTPTGATNTPPIAALKAGTVTTFQNGQKWTLGPDGQPKQVP